MEELEDYEIRLINEYNDLSYKIKRLKRFVKGNKPKK